MGASAPTGRDVWRPFLSIWLATFLGLTAVGAALPVLPRYVLGPLGAGNVAVGIVIGAFAATALLARPVAGRASDVRGRRTTVVVGTALTGVGGALYFLGDLGLGLGGLVFARLLVGAGEGVVFTAGAAWSIDLAPADRRARVVGLYGLSVWSGLTLGPPLGEALLAVGGYSLVWIACAGLPLVGTLLALRVDEPPLPPAPDERAPLIAREAVLPGFALAFASIGFATMASFLVLHLDEQQIGYGALVFAAFAATVVLTRVLGGGLPDRIGAAQAALIAAPFEAAGLALLALAPSLAVALVGAVVMGAAFSTLFPALSIVAIQRVPEHRRGSAMGTFSAFFDLGMGVGAPLAGVAAAAAGYPAAFWLSVAAALAGAALITRTVRAAPQPGFGHPATGVAGPTTGHS
ncbi:MAG: MFS transporter [Solirubrobacterales bacterium]